MSDELLSLAFLEGRNVTERKDGRARRTRSIPQNLRGRFLEVLDDDMKTKIFVYVTEEGKLRRDVAQVQEEISKECNWHDNESVDLEDVLEDGVDGAVVVEDIKNHKDELAEEDVDFDGVDDEDEEEEEVKPSRKRARSESDGDYEPEADDEEEEEDDDFTESEDDDDEEGDSESE